MLKAKNNGQVATASVSQKNKIQNEHSKFKTDVLSRGAVSASSTSNKKVKEFKNAFNGVAVELTKSQLNKAKNLPYVKQVYEDRQVQATLMDSLDIINAPDVWLLQDGSGNSVNGTGMTIAIIDTGIDYTHPDLGGCFGAGCKVADGYDIVNNDTDPFDDMGHGTHCAGIAAGNGVIKGVAPEATLYAYKVLDSGGYGSWSDVIMGIEYAVDPNQDGNFSDKVDVISMSLGGDGNPDDPVSTAVDNAVEAGVIAAISAGNSGPSEGTIGSPGTARKAITVGASDKNDNIAGFSSRGPTSIGTIKPDVTAPGVAIYSSVPTGSCRLCDSSGYKYLDGTSMAAPHVAGAAALIKQAHPDWTPDEVKHALRNTAVDIGYDLNIQGYGRIDVLDAVQLTNAPAIAWINTSGHTNETSLTITGTATGSTFANYFIEFSEDMQSWSSTGVSLTNNGLSQVTNGILGTLDTSSLNIGSYYLRLRVFTSDGKTSQDNTIITYIEQDAYEPDNTYDLANTIAVNTETQTHTQYPHDDNDFVKFDAVANETYFIKAERRNPDFYPMIEVYDTDGTSLLKEIDYYRGYWTPEASGTYYLNILDYYGKYYGEEWVGIYDLTVNGGPDIYEPDDTAAEATLLEEDIEQQHNFFPYDEVDYYKFDAVTGNYYTIKTFDRWYSYPKVELYDTDGTTLLRGLDGDTWYWYYATWAPETDGTYYVKVSNYDFELSGGSYSIVLEAEPGTDLDAYEPDSDYTQATQLATDGTIQSHNTVPLGDVDYIKFDAVVGNYYKITTSNLVGSDPFIQLFGSDGTTFIVYDELEITWSPAVDGTYYAQIREYWETDSGSYDVSITTGIAEMDLEAWYVYIENNKALINTTTEVEFRIENKGTATSTNAVASLYDYDYDIQDYVLIESKQAPVIYPGQNEYVYFNWTPTELGEHELKATIYEAGDIEPKNDEEIIYVTVVDSGPDLDVWGYLDDSDSVVIILEEDILSEHIEDFEKYKEEGFGNGTVSVYSVTVNQTYNYSVQVGNDGNQAANNTDIDVYFMHDYEWFGQGFDNTGYIDYNGTSYEITVYRIDENHARFAMSYDTTNEELELFEGQAILLGNGVIFDFDYMSSKYDYISYKLAQGSHSSENVSSIDVNDWYNTEFEWSPEKTGQAIIKAVADAPGEVNHNDNYDYEYVDVGGFGIDVKIDYFYYDYPMVANQDNEVVVILGNIGSEDALGINVSLYDDTNGILVDSQLVNLNVDEGTEVFLQWKPTDIGEYDLRAVAEIDGETTPENNAYEERVNVQEHGPNLDVYIFKMDTVVAGEETQVWFDVWNEGSETATNVTAEFYVDEVLTDTKSLPDLTIDYPGDKIEDKFTWVPTQINGYQLKVIVDTINETDPNNNDDYEFVTVLPNNLVITITSPVNGSTINTDSVQLSVTTDDLANCSYKKEWNGLMDAQAIEFPQRDSTEHSILLQGLEEFDYIIHIGCYNAYGGSSTKDVEFSIEFIVQENNPPTIDSFSPAGDVSLTVGENQAFSITASDPDSDPLTISWLLDGSEVGTGNSYSFSATATGSYALVVNVSDGELSATHSWSIDVSDVQPPPPPNQPPTITSYSPQEAELSIREDGTVDFSVTATDDISTPTITWYVNDADVGTGNSYSFTSTGAGDYAIKAVASDGELTDEQTWTVHAYSRPIADTFDGSTTDFESISDADIGNAQNVVLERTSYGKIEFNDGLDLTDTIDLDSCVVIEQNVAGIDNTCVPELNKPATITLHHLSYDHAPQIYYNNGFTSNPSTVNTPCAFCTVTDYTPAPTTDGSVTFTVSHFTVFSVGGGNNVPNANAGPDQYASRGATVTLSGGASTDSDGDLLTYSWTQTAGPGVVLSNPLIVNPSFMPTQTGTYTFQLVVSDGSLAASDSVNILIEENLLVIKDLEVDVDGKSKDVDNFETVSKEAKPGSTVEFEITVENMFNNNNGDLDIEDIDVEVTIKDIDEGDDMDKEYDEFDLDPGDDKTVKLSFDVPRIVEDGTFDVEITVRGEDENHKTHEVEWTVYLEVEKEAHEIVIDDAHLTPSSVKCGSYATLKVELINLGGNDEEDVVIEIESVELGLDILDEGIELEEGIDDDSTYDESYRFKVEEDVAPGSYPISVKVYRDEDNQEAYETVNLAVLSCSELSTAQQQVDVEGAFTTYSHLHNELPPAISSQLPQQPATESFFDSSWYTTLLVIAFIILLGGVIFMVGAVIILNNKKKGIF